MKNGGTFHHFFMGAVDVSVSRRSLAERRFQHTGRHLKCCPMCSSALDGVMTQLISIIRHKWRVGKHNVDNSQTSCIKPFNVLICMKGLGDG